MELIKCRIATSQHFLMTLVCNFWAAMGEHFHIMDIQKISISEISKRIMDCPNDLNVPSAL